MTVDTSKRTSARPVHSISFKCTDEQFIVADALRASFDPPTWAEAMRWLIDSPDVRKAIRTRVNGDAT